MEKGSLECTKKEQVKTNGVRKNKGCIARVWTHKDKQTRALSSTVTVIFRIFISNSKSLCKQHCISYLFISLTFRRSQMFFEGVKYMYQQTLVCIQNMIELIKTKQFLVTKNLAGFTEHFEYIMAMKTVLRFLKQEIRAMEQEKEKRQKEIISLHNNLYQIVEILSDNSLDDWPGNFPR